MAMLAVVASPPGIGPGPPPAAAQWTAAGIDRAAPARPLHGVLIALDAGHQLGNSRHPDEISQPVPAGGFTKPCNTTGTATDAGFAEATFNYRVTMRLSSRLSSLGARVMLTRHRNSRRLWGPCVDYRGRFGNSRPATLKISIHGDGSYSGGSGFHVIAPTDRAPWTSDIYRSSKRLARATRHGLVRSHFSVADYIAGGDGLDFRSDLATLNLSNIPTVMVELGNMRNRSDAAVMSSARGQGRYARALTHGIRAFLRR
jgi:N-acetylmuramoyl-L-alanine amidase